MHISEDELAFYSQTGYLFKPSYFLDEEIAVLKSQLRSVWAEKGSHAIREKNGLVRSVYGAHTSNEVFKKLVRHPKLLEPAMEILKNDVYVHQFKINAKSAMGGDIWAWHQDFIFWHKEDGLRTPDVINMTVFLDDVTEFNGPLMLIPGSHRAGMVDVTPSSSANPPKGEPTWITNVTADLKYSLSREMMSDLVLANGIAIPKGPAGSLLLFDANIFHGSASNMSPFDRAIVIVTYNSVTNPPQPKETPRPDFLASHDYTPLKPLPENCLTNISELQAK